MNANGTRIRSGAFELCIVTNISAHPWLNTNYLSVPDKYFNWRWVVTVAGIVELGTVRDEADHIACCDEFNVTTWCGNTVFEGELTFGRDGHVHEEVDVAGDVALAEFRAPVLDATDEAIATGVHVLFLMSVAHCITFT